MDHGKKIFKKVSGNLTDRKSESNAMVIWQRRPGPSTGPLTKHPKQSSMCFWQLNRQLYYPLPRRTLETSNHSCVIACWRDECKEFFVRYNFCLNKQLFSTTVKCRIHYYSNNRVFSKMASRIQKHVVNVNIVLVSCHSLKLLMANVHDSDVRI